MKVFFTASYSGKKYNQKYYNAIINILQDLGHEVLSLEIQTYSDIIPQKQREKLSEDEIHYEYIKKATDKAQMVVIEITDEKFRLGHEATLALLYNKPVLCLSLKKDFSKMIKHPKFYANQYTSIKELKEIIPSFIEEAKSKHLLVRFNSYLNPTEKNFLEKYSQEMGKTSSEVLRELIREKMRNILKT